jgi:hypothetical protein
MMRWLWVLLISGVCIQQTYGQSDATLVFEIEQDPQVYDLTLFGEPPQFAIWLENTETGAIKTVFVTRRTATGTFEGKTGVPIALPAWIGFYRKETGSTGWPTPRNPLDDAISGPTLKQSDLKKETKVPSGSSWKYYIEVNVSGDFTETFSAYDSDGTPDPHFNGQPSIIFRGEITATPGAESTPEIIGRTEQIDFSTTINPDLTGIESAKDLFRRIKVSCLRE